MKKRKVFLTLMLSVSMVFGNLQGISVAVAMPNAQSIVEQEDENASSVISENTVLEDLQDTDAVELSDEVDETENEISQQTEEIIAEGDAASVKIEDIFPDEDLRRAVNYRDLNYDGYLNDEEISQITQITYCSASDLTGIELLTALKKIELRRSEAEALDFTTCPSLEELVMFDCAAKTVKVSGLENLQKIEIDAKLTGIDLTGCSNLISLELRGNGNWVNDGSVAYFGNHIAKLDVTPCPKLQTLDLNNAGIEEIKGLYQLSELQTLSLCGSLLTELNVKGFENLTSVAVGGFEERTGYSRISSIDLTGCSKLTSIRIEEADITTLDLTGCSALTDLKVDYLKLQEVNLTDCSSLKNLRIGYSNLQSIDLTGCSSLVEINLRRNRLTSIDVSDCPLLIELNVEQNALESIDISNTKIQNLACGYMDSLTNLIVKDAAELVYLDATKTGITTLDVNGCTALKTIEANKSSLATFDPSPAKALTSLYVEGCRLSTLDVSKNPALTYLDCSRNALTSLILETQENLQTINCDENQLPVLDITGCSVLRSLRASYNKLLKLEPANSAENLRTLYCYNNKITKLELDQNVNLGNFNSSENALPALDLSKNEELYQAEYNNQVYFADYKKNESTGKYEILINAPDLENNLFEAKYVSEISDDAATLIDDGFAFDSEAVIPDHFSYCYNEYGKEQFAGNMVVNVYIANKERTVRLDYRNLSMNDNSRGYPRSYTTGGDAITLPTPAKEGAIFSKWVVWNYNGNPKNLPAITVIDEQFVMDNIATVSAGKQITLRAVFEPDVYEINYTNYILNEETGTYEEDYMHVLDDAINNPKTFKMGKEYNLKDGSKAGYIFKGWYEAYEIGEFHGKMTSIDATDEIYSTHCYLFGKWEKQAGGSQEPGATPTPSPGSNATPTPKPDGNATPTPKPDGNATPTPKPDGNATPTPKPDGNATPTPKPSDAPSVGTKKTDTRTKAEYEITSTGSQNTVTYTKTTNTNAKTVKVPKSVQIAGKTYKVTAIAPKAFKGNKKVQTVTIDAGVTQIAASAFEGCTTLKSVTIGKDVKSIGKKAFYNCKNLKTITIKANKLTDKTIGANAFGKINAKATVKVPKAKLASYQKILRKKGIGKNAKFKKA